MSVQRGASVLLVALVTAGCSLSDNSEPSVIIITPSVLDLAPGKRGEFTARVLDGDGKDITAELGLADVYWSLSPPIGYTNSGGARVSVTATEPGTATVTAQVQSALGTAQLSVSSYLVTVGNNLIRPVEITINGSAVGSVAGGLERDFELEWAEPGDLVQVEWELVRYTTPEGVPLGERMAGVFEPTAIGETVLSSQLYAEINNTVGNRIYFAPILTNNSGVPLLMGVNMGLVSENRCNCVALPTGEPVQFGYYQWFSNSNVRAYDPSNGYSGSYIFWEAPGNLNAPNQGAGTTGIVAVNPPAPPAGVTRGETLTEATTTGLGMALHGQPILDLGADRPKK